MNHCFATNQCKQHHSSWARKPPPIPLTSSLCCTLMLRIPWSWHGVDIQVVGTTSSPLRTPLALGREVTLPGGFGLSKHLCTPRVKPAAAQYIHLTSGEIQSTGCNQKSSHKAKPSQSRESLAWQCPDTSYGWAEFKQDCARSCSGHVCPALWGVPWQTSAPLADHAWLFCSSASTFSKEACLGRAQESGHPMVHSLGFSQHPQLWDEACQWVYPSQVLFGSIYRPAGEESGQCLSDEPSASTPYKITKLQAFATCSGKRCLLSSSFNFLPTGFTAIF